MRSDVVELLDRQHRSLARQSGIRFVLHLRRYLGMLAEDPRIALLLDDLRRESREALEAFGAHEQGIVERLVPLREELEAAGDPAADQRSRSAAQYLSWSNWDAKAAAVRDGQSVPEPGTDSVSQVDRLIDILYRRLHQLRREIPANEGMTATISESDLRPELADLQARLEAVAGDHRPVQHRLVDDTIVLAAFALVRLEGLVLHLDTTPQPRTEGPSALAWSEALVRQRFGPLVSLVLRGSSQWPEMHSTVLGDRGDSELETLVENARADVDLLHEELRRRVGLTRSRVGLILRFKQRCEWYDYDALRVAAGSAQRGAEAVLTRELARYLFDQGLNPIAEPLTGRLEPDVLDPSLTPSFYVEVKQYARGDRGYLRRGIWQLHDTMAALAASRYEAREAFYVVFRRDGPRYSFPEAVRGEQWVVYPVLIDLAPDVGSRGGRQAEAFSVAELEPRRAHPRRGRGSSR